MAASVAFLVEHGTTALIIIVYLFYEIHWGRLDSLANTIDEVVHAVIALARETRGVDEEAVVERLNGHTPKDLLEDEESGESRHPERKWKSVERTEARRRGDP